MPRQRGSLSSLLTLVLSLSLFPLAFSQSLIPSNLPACAAQCAVLQQAAQSCQANPSAAETCFCQSSLLVNLKNPATNICTPSCSAGDYATISAWYAKQCANGGVNAAGPSTTLSVVTVGQTQAATAASTSAAATSAVASTQGTGINGNQTGPEWWNTHWQWIVMLIVLIIGFTAIGVGGRWLFKRHQRKKEGLQTTPTQRTPDMGMWAPSRHSVHDFAGPSNSGPGPAPMAAGAMPAPAPGRQPSGKGKGRAGEPAGPMRSASKRLRKAANAMQM